MMGAPSLLPPLPSWQVNSLRFNAFDSVLVSGGYDRCVKAWDCRSNSYDPIQVQRSAGQGRAAQGSAGQRRQPLLLLPLVSHCARLLGSCQPAARRQTPGTRAGCTHSGARCGRYRYRRALSFLAGAWDPSMLSPLSGGVVPQQAAQLCQRGCVEASGSGWPPRVLRRLKTKGLTKEVNHRFLV